MNELNALKARFFSQLFLMFRIGVCFKESGHGAVSKLNVLFQTVFHLFY